MKKQKSFLKNLKKLITTHLDAGGEALFFAKPTIQNPNIQPGVFLAKMEGQQSMSFFIYCHLINF